ncbi:MAG: two-component regulator propeller domain-containing protein [Bacteroidota bacterium]|nr:two-component regulator propeller domain-containing protein [Bacteroidota bacterium]
MKSNWLFIFFLSTVSLNAANVDISVLTNNEGLSNSSINTINQDSNGLLWFGTWDGLNVYNGRDFKVYKPEPGNAQSISNNIIRDIVQEQKYIQWIATDRGINRLDTRKNTFERFFTDNGNQSISNEHSFFIARNSTNRIFAAVYDQGLFFFNSKTHQFNRLNAVKNYRMKKIFFDEDDNLWLYTEDKMLFKIVFKKGRSEMPVIENIVHFQHLRDIESVFYHSNNEIWMQTSDDHIYSYRISEGILSETPAGIQQVGPLRVILFMDNYQMWGTANGLYRYDLKANTITLVIKNISVLSLFAGTQQIIWVGTDTQGVWQLSPSKEKFRTFSAENIPSFGNSSVRTFFDDPNGTLWVGTKGNGIYTFVRGTDKLEPHFTRHFTTADGLLNNSVYTIVKGQENEYWIGTDGRGINYFDTRTKKILTLSVNDRLRRNVNLSSVYSILPTEQNILWAGTSGYGMYKLEIDRTTHPYSIKKYTQYIYRNDRSTSLSNNIVYSIIQDDATHLWIATRGGGLNRFNCLTGQFQHFRYSSQSPGFISSDDILCLYKDSQGFLWAGTSMGLNKLIRFEKGRPVFARFTEKDGMPNNTIHGILEDRDHNLWLSTNKGLAELLHDRSTYRIVSYFKKDGLQNNEFSDGAFYNSPATHQFYFGGISGFNEFNPLEIRHSNYIPSLLLDAFFVDNVEMRLSDFVYQKKNKETLILSYKNKSFSFKFIPLDYLSGAKCEISYLLEGFQKDWIQLGTSNTIVFTNLPTGDYVLKVRCSNADKIWSDRYFSLPVIIRPPWWASTLAYLCYLVLFIGLLFVIRQVIKNQINARKDILLKDLEKQKIEEIHQAKLRFFTNIAHEFSNSLTLIYGPCEQLLRTHASDDYTRKYINIIKSNSERMQTLIQQLIDFRKAETGHLRLEIEKVDIPELVKFVMDNFTEILEEKKIMLSLTFSPQSIVWKTDRDSIEKVVFNLVSNAVKYTPEDETIKILVEIRDTRLMIQITNTGVGIKPMYQQTIFDRFEVLERFERQVSKGIETRNGIGLALCKNIVEVLHGDIMVESDGDSFTSFVVSLPEQEIDESAPPKVHESQAVLIHPVELKKTETQNKMQVSTPDKLKEGLILIIDDENDIRELLCDFLGSKYEIAQAANGSEAIELMRMRMPMLIICDIIMPVMNGIEFIKIMKGQELTRHIPIILLSSKSSVESQIEGLEIGADTYLSKPFHPRHLEAIIESLLHRNKAILDYSESTYAALEQYEGKLIHKEDKELMLHITGIIHQQMDNESLSLDFIASETALSKMQLYRKMKELIGQTPTEYIRSIRLKHAEKLLKSTNKTVQEIMYVCGFNNKAYFYREFAKKYHLTPKEYRNQK